MNSSKTRVWRWQKRFKRKGVDSMAWSEIRPALPVRPLNQKTVDAIVALTLALPPQEAIPLDGGTMAEVAAPRDHRLAPRWRSFKLSKDLAFVEKLRDIVGFTCHRRADAVVLSR